jgi:hypothetical protein
MIGPGAISLSIAGIMYKDIAAPKSARGDIEGRARDIPAAAALRGGMKRVRDGCKG